MLKLKYFIASLLIWTLTGCVSEYNANLPAGEQNRLVVNGNIIANTDVVFSLSRSFSLDNDKVPNDYNAVEATIVVTGDDGYRSSPGVKVGQGQYRVSIGELDDNVSYNIEIECGGETYASTPARPLSTPPIDSISWVQPVPEKEVTIRVSTHEQTNGPQYYMWNYLEDWEFTSNYLTDFYFDPVKNAYYIDKSHTNFFCWRQNASNGILIGSTDKLTENRIINTPLYKLQAYDEKVSYLYSVLVRQKSLSKEAYEYYLNLQKQNENMGGLFTPQPSEVQGNIYCTTHPEQKVIGYVEVLKNVEEQRIFISRSSIKRPIVSSPCLKISDGEFIKMGMLTLAERYSSGYRPVGIAEDPPQTSPDFWSHGECVDCEMAGGSRKRPDFWPNNH